MPPDSHHPDRRRFLSAAAGVVSAAVVTGLSGCGGGDGDGDGTPEPLGSDTPAPRPRGPLPPAREPSIRVRILRQSPDAGPLRLEPASGSLRVHAMTPDGEATGVARLTGPVDVTHDGRGWRVVDGFGRRHDDLVARDESLEVHDADGGTTSTRRGQRTTAWPAVLRVEADSGDADADGGSGPTPRPGGHPQLPEAPRGPASVLHLVNHVPVESYLPGVLAGELPASWHPETFAALAIAARTYAVFGALHRPSPRWDLESDSRSQMFVGADAPERARDAVHRTHGRVLLASDRLFPAYYSSACGGLGAAARDAIGPDAANDVAPLTGHGIGDCCRRSPRFEWSLVRTPARAAEQLAAQGRRARRTEWRRFRLVTAIEPGRRNAFGRPIDHVVRGEDASGAPHSATVPAEGLRRALHTGRRAGESPAWSGFIVGGASTNPATLVITGRGWGHGAGLCQYGAQSMAAAGANAAAILAAYYPSAELRSAWPVGGSIS